MKEKPSSLEKALELAQAHEAVEAAQKRLQGKQSVALVHQSPEEHVGEAVETNTLQRSTVQRPSEQLQDLSRQVQQLAETVACLSIRTGNCHSGRTQKPWQPQGESCQCAGVVEGAADSLNLPSLLTAGY